MSPHSNRVVLTRSEMRSFVRVSRVYASGIAMRRLPHTRAVAPHPRGDEISPPSPTTWLTRCCTPPFVSGGAVGWPAGTRGGICGNEDEGAAVCENCGDVAVAGFPVGVTNYPEGPAQYATPTGA